MTVRSLFRRGQAPCALTPFPCFILHDLPQWAQPPKHIHRDAQKRHQSAGADPALHPDDGVDDAYDEYLGAVRDVHDTVEALREWIVTRDAVLEPSTGDTHASADALFAAILSGP